jgi:hypothetical protein
MLLKSKILLLFDIGCLCVFDILLHAQILLKKPEKYILKKKKILWLIGKNKFT